MLPPQIRFESSLLNNQDLETIGNVTRIELLSNMAGTFEILSFCVSEKSKLNFLWKVKFDHVHSKNGTNDCL